MGIQGGAKTSTLRAAILTFLLPLTSIWIVLERSPALYNRRSFKHTSKVCSSSNMLLPLLIAFPNQSRSRLRFFMTTVSSLEIPPQTSANMFGYSSHNIGRRGELYVFTGSRHSLTSSLLGRSHLGMVECGVRPSTDYICRRKNGPL